MAHKTKHGRRAKHDRPYGNREMFARLWQGYLRQHSPAIGLAMVLMVLKGSTLGILSWMLKPVFDLVFVGGQADAILWVGQLRK